jgi:heme exporter protein D
MYFSSVQAALYMDGHGAYVWTAYALTLLVLVVLLVTPILRQQRVLRELRGELRRASARATKPDLETRT